MTDYKDNKAEINNDLSETVNNPASIPYLIFESIMNRKDKELEAVLNKNSEDKNKLHILIIILIVVNVIIAAIGIGSNIYWLYVWNQYEYEATETITVDGKDGVANYIGNGNKGTITYGENNSDQSKDLEKEKVGDEQRSETKDKKEVTP